MILLYVSVDCHLNFGLTVVLCLLQLLSLRYWLDRRINKTVTWFLRHQAIVSSPWETLLYNTRAFSSALLSICLFVRLSISLCLSVCLYVSLSALPTLQLRSSSSSLVVEALSNRLILDEDRKAVHIHGVSETQKRMTRKLCLIFFDRTFCSIARMSAWAFVALGRFLRWPVNV